MKHHVPLSWHQERLWFIDTFEKGKLYEASPVYHNLPLIITIEGRLDVQALQDAVRYVTCRHEVLRYAVYSCDEPFPVMQVSDCSVSPSWEQLPWPEGDIATAAETFISRPFNLYNNILHRCLLFTNGTDRHCLVWVLHHFIADRTSLGVLYNDVFKAYNECRTGDLVLVTKPGLQYSDYASWQRNMPEEAREGLFLHWKHQLGSNPQILEFPTDYPRMHIHLYNAGRHTFHLSPALVAPLKQLAAKADLTLKETLMAAFILLLKRYSGLDEIVTGTYGENHQEYFEHCAGPADNLLVLRNYIHQEDNFIAHARRVAATLQTAIAYQDMPFEQLSDLLRPAKDMSRTVFFDILFHYEKAAPVNENGDSRWRVLETNSGLGKYDMNLLMVEDKEVVTGYLTYNTLFFEEATIAAFTQNFTWLLQQAFEQPDAAICRLPVLHTTQEAHLLQLLDNTQVAYNEADTLTGLFEAQVRRYPENIAVVFEQQQYTYAALNSFVNRFAAYLQGKGVTKNDFVAISLPRCLELPGVILAVLKAGGCYVPVDPEYPQDRIAYIHKDSQSKVLVTAELLQDFYQYDATHTLIPVPVEQEPDQLAYVIYTSGTTGNPKGVQVSHRNVVRLLFNDNNLFDFKETDVWTMFHSYCFDFSVWEMYGALLYGGKLIVVPAMVAKDTFLFHELLRQHQVTVLNQTPSAFYRLLEVDEHKVQLPWLRYVVFGGEALSPLKLKYWKQCYPAMKLVNMYGITETTVHVTYKEITDYEIEHNISSIGKPIPTLGCYLLDDYQNLVPRGVVGELYVSGAGVAHGYLNKPELTAKKFLKLPVAGDQLLYRSGDLARIQYNGDLEYLGRADNQVKIRGHRIELAEIETNLLRHEEVENVVVLPCKEADGTAFLAAYYTGTAHAKNLKLYLQLKVPAYMVPACFIPVPVIPVTVNGKVDRAKLPPPYAGEQYNSAAYSAPVTAAEVQLANIWKTLLNVPQVGRADSFFELGGHSLKATQLIARVAQQLSVSIRLSDVFAHPVLEELALLIQQKQEAEGVLNNPASVIAPAAVAEVYPLSPAQKRMWVLHHLENNSTVYNIANAFRIKGNIQAAVLQQAITWLMGRHEILRTVFEKNASGDPVQRVLPVNEMPDILTIENRQQHTADEVTLYNWLQQQAAVSFTLHEAPLWRVCLLQLPGNEQILAYTMHHIISDGWSLQVFFTELLQAYTQLLLQKEPTGTPLPFQYKDYAVWCNNQLNDGVLQQQKEYWKNCFTGEWKRADPGDQKPRPSVKTFRGKVNDYTIPVATQQGLRNFCNTNDSTLYMGLLSAVLAVTAQQTSLTDIIIGTPVAGRELLSTENQLGLYVNTLALRTRFSLEDSFETLLANVKQVVSGGFDNQQYPFDALVEELALQRNPSRTPLFDTMVVLQNTYDIQVNGKLPTLPEGVTAQVLAYSGATSKFDLTWFFDEGAAGELLLRLEYNTDIYEAHTIDAIADSFMQLLAQLLGNSTVALNALPAFGPQQLKQLAAVYEKHRQAPVEFAGMGKIAPAQHGEKTAPLGNKEERIAAAWKEVLQIDAVGRMDDFFALGGDSIKALQLISALRRDNLDITIATIMRYATLAQMAQQVTDGRQQISQDTVTGAVPLSPVQHFFFTTIPNYLHQYNQSVMIKAPQLEAAAVKAAMQQLLHHHDMLRAEYTHTSEGWQQTIPPTQQVQLDEFVLDGATAAEPQIETICNRLQASLQPEKGPLFKAALFHSLEESFLLLYAHHLITDGVSWRILLEDFNACYEAAIAGKAAVLPEKTHAYLTWTQHIQEQAAGESAEAVVSRWNTLLEQITPLPGVPAGKVCLEENAFTVTERLSAAESRALQAIAGRVLKADIQDLLLASLGLCLQKEWQLNDVVVMMEHHGRDQVLSLNLSRTVGWFTTLYPFLLPAAGSNPVQYLLQVKKQLHETRAAAPSYGMARFLLPQSGIATAMPHISFNYLGQFSSHNTINTFTLTNEGKGKEKHPLQQRAFALDVKAALVDEVLELSFTADATAFTAAAMQRLLAAWKEALLQLSDNCSAAAALVALPGAIELGLSLEQMQQLQQQHQAQKVYALSPMQQSFFYYHLRYPASTAYFEQMRYRLQGPMDENLVANALQQLAQRHAVMRTIFNSEYTAQPIQVVTGNKTPEFVYHDLRGTHAGNQEALLEQAALDDRNRGFRLQEELPVRWQLFRLANDVYEWIFSFHHIIMDGWCLPLLLQEFQQLYAQGLHRSYAVLPVPVAYSEYINWLQQYDAAAGKRFWKNYLAGFEGITGVEKEEAAADTHAHSRNLEHVELTIAGGQLNKLEQFVKDNAVTLNEAVQALWAVLLGIYNNSNDIVFGTVVSGRPPQLEGVESMIGLFINSVPARVQYQTADTFVAVMKQIRNNSIDALPYHYTPLADIQSAARGGALFNHLLVFRNYPAEEKEAPLWRLLQLKAYEPNSYNFSVHVLPEPERLTIRLVYHPHCFSQAAVEAIKNTLEVLLQSVLAQPAVSIHQLQQAIQDNRNRQRAQSRGSRLNLLVK